MTQRTHMQDRILSRVVTEDRGYDTPCWVSDRAKQAKGYTKIGVNGSTMLTHRVAYAEWIGPIPEGYQIDHLCRVTACCNPDHLEAVTPRENLMRGDTLAAREVAQTHCKRGHPLAGPNLYERPDRPNGRGCRTCRDEATRRSRQRLTA